MFGATETRNLTVSLICENAQLHQLFTGLQWWTFKRGYATDNANVEASDLTITDINFSFNEHQMKEYYGQLRQPK